MKEEILYGPLELKADLDYEIVNCFQEDIYEICEYTKYNTDYEFTYNDIKKIINESFFSRIIRLNLDYVKPIVGVIFVNKYSKHYDIIHLSVHRNFRQQGIGKLLVYTLANFLNNTDNKDIEYVGITIPASNHNLFRISQSFNFEKHSRFFGYFDLRKKINEFIEIINSPII
jgi:ribosomal protein S18 acetylase RimI-like enzyme